MKMEFMSNLPPIGESVAKMASEGGRLITDIVSVYGFFIVCLVFVGFSLMVPVRIYEKYYRLADDEATEGIKADSHQVNHPAA